ncbi:serine/threonine protein phosphatase PP2A-associated protein [Mycena floridula]|nr:serine/threonine protein phosphatase PP2A-associated protein [Mycena floridula]
MSAIPIHVQYSRALAAAAKASRLPTIEDHTQDLIRSSLTDLATLQSRILGLALFSPNETLEDISTRDLIYLSVSYVLSEVEGRVRTTVKDERLVALDRCSRHLHTFLSHLENFGIIPEEERTLFGKKASAAPANRRELKIKQYKKEKDLRVRIETIRKRRDQRPIQDEVPSDFDLISSLLPSTDLSYDGDDEDDSDTDEVLREAMLLLFRLFFAQAQSQLESMEQELQLLRTAPNMSPSPRPGDNDDRRSRQRDADNDMWKIDAPSGLGTDGKGPLMDSTGKPLRPFTILPSGSADRERLQAQVFASGHRLPTMSIDEYLEIERQRGNIITGGGKASETAPTSSEELALAAEMDGTAEGREKEEEKRLKDENWASFTDANPRGAGNTMNRG